MTTETCDICRKRPATTHLVQIFSGVKTEIHLCDDCLRCNAPEMGIDDFPLDLSKGCFYCGASACCGGLNQGEEALVRGEKFHYTCSRCAELELRLMCVALEAIPKDLNEGKQRDALVKVISEVDRCVREEIRKAGRDSDHM